MTTEFVSVPEGLSVGSDLLRVSAFEPTKRRKGAPLMMEFKVNPATGPFLVSSTRGVVWVSPREPIVRAAFRIVDSETLFRDVVQSVVETGVASNWGNVHPLNMEGVLAAIAYLRSYELSSLEILMHPGAQKSLPLSIRETDGGETVRTLCGFPVEMADWLPPETLIVVPQDRDYVGFFLSYGERGVAVVHNASRGIAICR